MNARVVTLEVARDRRQHVRPVVEGEIVGKPAEDILVEARRANEGIGQLRADLAVMGATHNQRIASLEAASAEHARKLEALHITFAKLVPEDLRSRLEQAVVKRAELRGAASALFKSVALVGTGAAVAVALLKIFGGVTP